MNATDKSDLFLSVLETHKGILFKVANSYGKNSDDRNDLIQEITLQLWKSFDQYQAEFKYSTWIYRIALNVAISFYRREKTRSQNRHPLSDTILNISETNTGSEIEENLRLLQQFIYELKELDKALMLLYLEEKSYREIADMLGITETNVATKISRIKAALKQKFADVNP